MEYKPIISPKMKAVAEGLTEAFLGMNHCITETGRNLVVEVPKSMCEEVRATLKRLFPDVAMIRNAYPMLEDLHDFILVKPLISEAPIYDEDGISVPNLEKILVDLEADKEYASLGDSEVQKEFQRAFELYPVNRSRLLRYAGRKGKKEEIRSRIDMVDMNRVEVVHAIQNFFQKEPVERAWLFGSFSRMEERPDSDIDILVDLDHAAPIELLQYAGMVNNLEGLLGRKVDLVANGSVKPFAQPNINRDKVLIYERA